MRNLRLLLGALLLVVVLVLTGWLTWYFAYGVAAAPETQVQLAGVEAPIRIQWHDEGWTEIDASSDADAAAALGYAHGQERTWLIVLARQFARGSVSRWLGSEWSDVDSFARALALYQEADGSGDSLLRAYSRGVNAALERQSAALSDELALLKIDPEPWTPADSRAVGRLYSWLSTPPLHADSLLERHRHRSQEVDRLVRADSALRATLHLYHFDRSAAWTGRADGSQVISSQYVYGSSALPLFHETRLRIDTSQVLVGGGLPGTLYVLAGRSPEAAWAVLPESSYRVATSRTSAPPQTRSRLIYPDESEKLVSYRRSGTRLFIDSLAIDRPDTLAADSLRTDSLASRAVQRHLTLEWTASQQQPAWPTWFAPSEWNADGLLLRPSGSWQLMGDPDVVVDLPEGVFISRSPWRRYAGLRLRELQADSAASPDWLDDCYSAWAEQLLPALLLPLESPPPDWSPALPELTDDALTYLRNWDYSYDGASIAAPLFETWLTRYRKRYGELPTPNPQMLTRRELQTRLELIDSVLIDLEDEVGRDMSRWRWERLFPEMHSFPLWGESRALPARARYAPVDRPGYGHPSTLCGGSSPLAEGDLASSRWHLWVRSSDWDQVHVQRRRLDTEHFLDRYRIARRPPPPITIRSSAEGSETMLLPAEASE